jgi:DNA-directed RNA polymerase subunit RPC12/RpoP
LKKNIGNTLIYLGFRLGSVAILAAILMLVVAIATNQGPTTQSIFWMAGLTLFGATIAYFSKRRWTHKYDLGLPVPCLICAKEFKKEPSQFSDAGTMRQAEITCPNCNGTTWY